MKIGLLVRDGPETMRVTGSFSLAGDAHRTVGSPSPYVLHRSDLRRRTCCGSGGRDYIAVFDSEQSMKRFWVPEDHTLRAGLKMPGSPYGLIAVR